MKLNYILKNKKLIYILVIVLIIIVVLVIVFNNVNKTYRKELNNGEKIILAEKAYMNFASGFKYKGKAIFNDGTIYQWDFKSNKLDYEANTLEEHTKWIFEHGAVITKKATIDDLEEMERLIKDLDNNIERKNTAYDMGSNYIAVWDANNDKVVLKESGNYTGENKSDNSQKLIDIINKYLK